MNPSISSPEIFPATWRDLRDLYQLEKICFGQDAWPLLDLLGVLSFSQVIRLKAVFDPRMVGFIAADLRHTKKTAWIATLAVHPDFQRSGIGTMLLVACEAKIPFSLIRLSVRRTNQPAIQLYLKHGYEQVDIWKSYYRGGDDGLIFEKQHNPDLLPKTE
jgi:ribosomal-protein-alanine N-acetyltransferase